MSFPKLFGFDFHSKLLASSLHRFLPSLVLCPASLMREVPQTASHVGDSLIEKESDNEFVSLVCCSFVPKQSKTVLLLGLGVLTLQVYVPFYFKELSCMAVLNALAG